MKKLVSILLLAAGLSGVSSFAQEQTTAPTRKEQRQQKRAMEKAAREQKRMDRQKDANTKPGARETEKEWSTPNNGTMR